MRTFHLEMPWTSSMRVSAEKVVRTLQAAGHEALFAGGCVRDTLLNHEPSDYDVATSAPPDTVSRLFRPSRKVGAKFGVVLVRSGRHAIEVATFRKEADYQDGRHPTQVTFTDAKEDALRRDFTLNGMFYDPVRAQVIDYVGGRNDITLRLIRAIGDPSRRFAEDHLRMLRAIRFASRLRFDIETTTWQAIVAHAAEIRRISAERVREELEMMSDDATIASSFRMLCASGLLVYLFRGAEVVHADRERVQRWLESLDHVHPKIVFAIIFSGLTPGGVNEACRSLRFSNKMAASIRWLVEKQHALDEPERLTLADLKLLMAHPDFSTLVDLFHARLRAEGQSDVALQVLNARLRPIGVDDIAPHPLIVGEHLEALGVPKGPIYKRILERLYYMQLNQEIHDEVEGLELAKKLIAAESSK